MKTEGQKSTTTSESRTAGAVRIRLSRSAPDGEPERLEIPADRDDKILDEITGSLSRQRKPREEQHVHVPLTRVGAMAQISMVGIATYIGVVFGSLTCLAFILFFCLPIAMHLWSDKKTRRA